VHAIATRAGADAAGRAVSVARIAMRRGLRHAPALCRSAAPIAGEENTLTPLPHEICACPQCRGALAFSASAVRCSNTACRYGGEPGFPIVAGRPALIDFDNSVIDRDGLLAAAGASYMRRRGALKKRLFRAMFGDDRSAAFAADEFHALCMRRGMAKPRLLVIGGGTVGFGMEALFRRGYFETVAFDIYASPHVQLIADAHAIPFADDSFDAVWVQAVLEHVLQPERVVEEIHRVLRPGGLVYAGTPFMQQVHEGAYDFTRFTQLGHRWLFRRFDCIAEGAEGGPGIALLWAIRIFVEGLTRSTKAGRLAELAFFWLRFFEKLMPAPRVSDGAAGVWFLGRQSDRTVTPKEIIGQYRGAQLRRAADPA
jgi:Methyltransferase domain